MATLLVDSDLSVADAAHEWLHFVIDHPEEHKHLLDGGGSRLQVQPTDKSPLRLMVLTNAKRHTPGVTTKRIEAELGASARGESCHKGSATSGRCSLGCKWKLGICVELVPPKVPQRKH